MFDTSATQAKIADKSPPHNLDAEQALLGALLIDNDVLSRIEGLSVSGATFYDPVHGRLFETIAQMINKGALADGITLHSKFQEDGALAEIGGTEYLCTIVDSAADPEHAAPAYAKLLIDLALRRDLLREGETMVASVRAMNDNEEGAAEILETTASRLSALERGSEHKLISIMRAMTEATIEAQMVFHGEAAPNGISTGLRALDAKCGLLKPGMLVTVAGRPGMGKSAVAVELGRSFAQRGIGVGYFSLEMDALEHGNRVAASIAYTNHARIPYENIPIGKMSADQLKMLTKCALEAEKLPFLIDDRGTLPFDRITSRIRALDKNMVKRFGTPLKVVIIDHLGLMQAPKTGFGGNRVQEVSEMTAALKRIARSMGLVVILLSQLNRAVESREDKRPLLNDLRESGSIEQDSDQVWLLYREAYYLNKEMEKLYAAGKAQQVEYDDLRERRNKVKDALEIDVAKRRGGKGGRAILNCFIQYNALRDPIGLDDGDDAADEPAMEGML